MNTYAAVSTALSPWQLSGVLCAGVMALALAGCAGSPGAAGSLPGLDSPAPARTDAADADESELRRRARIRLELASNYFDQGQTLIALEEARQAIVTDPTYSDAFNLRGLIYMRLNDPRLAEDNFRRAISLNARDANALHNYGWLLCQQARYPEALLAFRQAMSNPIYPERAKTLMTQGLCQARAGQRNEAESSLARSYELDAGNPVTGYNLALLLYQRGEFARAQFYIRRINNSEQANAETLWLGVRVERRMQNQVAMMQLAEQLKKRFPQSREAAANERGAFDE
ncbi:MAG: type IV pilus biogenesis/stability protein PilW [Burkholderiaceae bacterium]|nr:type IV pilus biogenesis/stability protein PilW [Burkholderiaceae bacterium]MDO9090235.1 type IV pilus biogenesis/stability protein PilW [Burkholderiaceae bacterium]MDP1968303.1 type IV pilus biogenesis/stability protein PilW [Burkholderiaceae bacterium]